MSRELLLQHRAEEKADATTRRAAVVSGKAATDVEQKKSCNAQLYISVATRAASAALLQRYRGCCRISRRRSSAAKLAAQI